MEILDGTLDLAQVTRISITNQRTFLASVIFSARILFFHMRVPHMEFHILQYRE